MLPSGHIFNLLSRWDHVLFCFALLHEAFVEVNTALQCMPSEQYTPRAVASAYAWYRVVSSLMNVFPAFPNGTIKMLYRQ